MSFRLDWIDKWTVDKYRDVTDTDEKWKLKKKFMLAHCESYPAERLLYWTQIFSNIIYQECSYPASIMTEVEKLSRTVFTSEHAILQNRLYRLLVDALKSEETVTKSNLETSRNITACDIEKSQQSRDKFVSLLTKKDESSPSKQESEKDDWVGFNIPSNNDSFIEKISVSQDSSPVKENSRNSVLDAALLTVYGEEGYLHDDDDDDEDYYLAPDLESSPSPTHISPNNSDNRMYHDYKNEEKGSLVSDYDRKSFGEVFHDSASRMSNFNGDLSPEEHRQSRNRSPISDYDGRRSSRLFDGPFRSRSPVPVYKEKVSARMQNTDLSPEDHCQSRNRSPISDYDGKSSSRLFDGPFQSRSPVPVYKEKVSARMQNTDLSPEDHCQSRNRSPILDYGERSSSKLYDDPFQSRSPVHEERRSTRMQSIDIKSTSNVLDRDDEINPDDFDCESVSSRRQSSSQTNVNRQLETLKHVRESASKIYNEDDGNFLSTMLEKDLSGIQYEFSRLRDDKSPERNLISYPILSRLSLDILSKLDLDKNELCKENDDEEAVSHKMNYNEKKSIGLYKKEDKNTSRGQDRDSSRHDHYNRKNESPEQYYDRKKSKNLNDDRNNRRKRDDSKSPVSRHERDSRKSRKLDDDRINRKKRNDPTHKSPNSRHDKNDSSKSRKQDDDTNNRIKRYDSTRKSPVSRHDDRDSRKSRNLDDDRSNRRREDDSTHKSSVSIHDKNNRRKKDDRKSPVSRHERDSSKSRKQEDDRNNRIKKDDSIQKSPVSRHDIDDSSKSRKLDDSKNNRIKRDDSTRRSPVSRYVFFKNSSRPYDEESRRKHTRDSPTNQKDNQCNSREQKSPVSKYDRCSKSKKKHSSHSNSDSECDERNYQRKQFPLIMEKERDRKCKEYPEKSIASRLNIPEMSQAEVNSRHSSSLESKSLSGLGSSMNSHQPQPNLYLAEQNFNQPQPNFPHLQPDHNQPQPNFLHPQPDFIQPQPYIQPPCPDFHQLQPNSYQPQPIVHQLQPNSFQPQPIVHQLQPNSFQPQPIVHQVQPIVHQLQPNSYQPQPIVHQLQPNFHQPQPIVHQLQPNFHQPQPNLMNWAHPMAQHPQLTLQQQTLIQQHNVTVIGMKNSNNNSSTVFKKIFPNKPNISSSSILTQVQKTNNPRKTAISTVPSTSKPENNDSAPIPVLKTNHPRKTASSASTLGQKTDGSDKAASSKPQNAISMVPSTSKPTITSSSFSTQKKNTKDEDLPNNSNSAATTQLQKTDGSNESAPCKPSNANSKVGNNTSNVEADPGGVSNVVSQTQQSSDQASENLDTPSNEANISQGQTLPGSDNSSYINQVLSKFANRSTLAVPPTGLNMVAQLQMNHIAQLQTILSCGIIPLNFNPPVQGIAPLVPGSSSSNPITKSTITKVPQVQNNSKKKKKANTQVSSSNVPSSSTSQIQKTTTSVQKPLSSGSVSIASGKPTVTVPPNNNKRKLADALGKAPECIITLDDDGTPCEKVPKLDTDQKLSVSECITVDDDEEPSEKVPKLDTPSENLPKLDTPSENVPKLEKNQKPSEEIDWKTSLPKESVRFYTQSKNSKITPCLKSLEEINMGDIRGRTGPLNSVAIICLAKEHEAKTLKRLNLFMDNIKLEVMPKIRKEKWNCRVIAHYLKKKRSQVICEAQAERKADAVKAACCRVLWYLQHIYFTFVIKNNGPPESSDIKSSDFTLLRFCQNGLHHTMPARFLDDEKTCTKVPFTTDKDLEFYTAEIKKYHESYTSESNSIKFLSFSPEISEETTSSLITIAKNLELQVRWKTDSKSGLVVYCLTKKLYWNFCKTLFNKCKSKWTSKIFYLLRPHETTVQYEQSYATFIQ